MKRIEPDKRYDGAPCSLVAVSCAAGEYTAPPSGALSDENWMTRDSMNKFIRSNLDVQRFKWFSRKEGRPLFKTLPDDLKAIVLVTEHYVYCDGNGNYYSFFDNNEDEVLGIWYLK